MPVKGEDYYDVGNKGTLSMYVFNTSRNHVPTIHIYYTNRLIAIIYNYENLLIAKDRHHNSNHVLINDTDNHYIYIGDNSQMYRFYSIDSSPIVELSVEGRGETIAYSDVSSYNLSKETWSYNDSKQNYNLPVHNQDLDRLYISPHYS